jgi:hypothetical protein
VGTSTPEQLVGIAKTLGIDSPIANEVTSVASKAFEAFTTFSSGNILGAVSAVTSIFGMGRPDVAELRHEEEMKAIKQVPTR